jgi:hypothetical protein
MTITRSPRRAQKSRAGRWGAKTPDQRVFEKVFIDFATGCWIWTAARREYGYGVVHYRRKVWRAHALMFKLYGGVVPEGLVLDHLCRVTSCVNPEHLEPVTPAENTQRMFAAIGHYNDKKENCLRGHEFAPATLTPQGHRKRRCPTCARDHYQAYVARQKARSAA